MNVDQELSSWIHLSANTNVIHSLSKRGLSNNDNAGTSPYLVFPFTPSFVDLEPTQTGAALVPSDFPQNPFERSNPLQTFQFLKNDEDTWRALGTLTAQDVAAGLGPQLRSQLIAIGGADYFEQDNDFVSPPGLEYEPNDGQPGTVVLGKASNLNLNIALNGNYIYHPRVAEASRARSRPACSTKTASSTRPRSSRARFSRARRTPTRPRASPCSRTSGRCATSGVYGQEELLLMDRRLLLHRRASGPTGAAPTATPGSTSSTRRRRRRTASSSRSAGSTRSSSAARSARPATSRSSAPSSRPIPRGTIGGIFGTFPGPRAGDPDHQAGDSDGVRDRLRRHAGRRPLALSVHGLPADDQQPAARADAGARARARRPASSARTASSGTAASRPRSPSPRSRPERQLDLHHDLLPKHQQDHEARPSRPSRPAASAPRSAPSRSSRTARRPRSSGTEGKVGDAAPDFQMSFSNDLQYRRLSLGFLWDWKQGGDIVNLTEFLYDAGQNSKDYVGGGPAAAGRLRQRAHQDLRPGRLVPQAPGGDAGVQPPREHHAGSLRLRGALCAALAGRPEPAPVHRLSRTRPRSEQLRQPGHRQEYRRGAVPAEPAASTSPSTWASDHEDDHETDARAAPARRSRHGSLQFRPEHQSEQPRRDRGQPEPRPGLRDGQRHADRVPH